VSHLLISIINQLEAATRAAHQAGVLNTNTGFSFGVFGGLEALSRGILRMHYSVGIIAYFNHSHASIYLVFTPKPRLVTCHVLVCDCWPPLFTPPSLEMEQAFGCCHRKRSKKRWTEIDQCVAVIEVDYGWYVCTYFGRYHDSSIHTSDKTHMIKKICAPLLLFAYF
jgi:hypothetical protein